MFSLSVSAAYASALDKSRAITQGLHRTRNQLVEQLQKSEHAHAVLRTMMVTRKRRRSGIVLEGERTSQSAVSSTSLSLFFLLSLFLLLDESTSRLQDTNTVGSDYQKKLREGRSVFARIERRELTDKALLVLSLVFFFLVLLLVVRDRLLARMPLWDVVVWMAEKIYAALFAVVGSLRTRS